MHPKPYLKRFFSLCNDASYLEVLTHLQWVFTPLILSDEFRSLRSTFSGNISSVYRSSLRAMPLHVYNLDDHPSVRSTPLGHLFVLGAEAFRQVLHYAPAVWGQLSPAMVS